MTFRWGTITDDSPLRVRLDGDSSELPFTPDSLVDPLTLSVADRVRCEISGHRLVVHGRSGGLPESDSPFPTGLPLPWTSTTAPTGFLFADGSAVSRSTYAALFAHCNPVIGTFTITIASPGVATLTAHGRQTGQQVYLTTTGALPTGLSANTNYWMIRVTANTFRLATSQANALAGTAINTSGTQSGTHTVRSTFGVGNGSTTFNVPLMSGKSVVGVDTAQTEFAALGQTGGAKTHTLTAAEIPAHQHGIRQTADGGVTPNSGASYVSGQTWSFNSAGTIGGVGLGNWLTLNNTGGGGAHNNLPPYIALPWIIKT